MSLHKVYHILIGSIVVFDYILPIETWISGLSAAYNDVTVHHEKETLAAGVAIKGPALPKNKPVLVLSLSTTSDTGMSAMVIHQI